MSVHVRVCRECGEEYRPEIVRCADCGGPLDDRFEEEGSTAPVRPPAPVAPAGSDLTRHRAVFVSGRATELVPLAEGLREAEIGFHLRERPASEEGRPASFVLLVHEDDVADALRALAPLLPAEEGGPGVQAVETHYEAGRGYVRCPACDAGIEGGARECPECGLTLGANDAPACPRCASPVAEGDESCPSCGAPIPA